jgi:hypothetical protein
MQMPSLNRRLWLTSRPALFVIILTSLCASTSLAQVDDPRFEKWRSELRRAIRDEEYARTGPMANIVLTMRNASDPYLYWTWIEGFARGAREEIDEQILRARTGIEISAINCHFGPASARMRAYARAESAGHGFIEGIVHEVEM